MRVSMLIATTMTSVRHAGTAFIQMSSQTRFATWVWRRSRDFM